MLLLNLVNKKGRFYFFYAKHDPHMAYHRINALGLITWGFDSSGTAHAFRDRARHP